MYRGVFILKKNIYIFILILIILFPGCSSERNPEIGSEYLKHRGYDVISYEGNIETYQLTKETLTQLRYLLLWSVQKTNPVDYLGKQVYVEKFIVKNHPLDAWRSALLHSLGKTEIHLFIIGNKVVGGISAPVIKGDNTKIASNIYSLEGKNITEVHSMDFNTWKEQLLKSLENVDD